jgi:hypothetical protein
MSCCSATFRSTILVRPQSTPRCDTGTCSPNLVWGHIVAKGFQTRRSSHITITVLAMVFRGRSERRCFGLVSLSLRRCSPEAFAQHASILPWAASVSPLELLYSALSFAGACVTRLRTPESSFQRRGTVAAKLSVRPRVRSNQSMELTASSSAFNIWHG